MRGVNMCLCQEEEPSNLVLSGRTSQPLWPHFIWQREGEEKEQKQSTWDWKMWSLFQGTIRAAENQACSDQGGRARQLPMTCLVGICTWPKNKHSNRFCKNVNENAFKYWETMWEWNTEFQANRKHFSP